MRTGFISSTVLDLKDLRNFLSFELSAHGFKMLLSEEGTIPADSSKHSYDLCIDAARKCEFLIAIIDGRFGGEVPGTGKSITLAEIEASLDAGNQVLVFVRQSVWDAKETLRPYMKSGVKFRPSKVIGDIRVFDVIDAVRRRVAGNWLFTFNRGDELLAILAEQLQFSVKRQDDPAVDKLDRILARKAIRAFDQQLMTVFIQGVQVQVLPVWAAEEFEDAFNMFVPQSMRFAGKHSSVLFEKFMDLAATLNNEAPFLFGPSGNPNKYTSRLSREHEIRPEYQERIDKLNTLAIDTFKAWVEFMNLVRNKWPDLFLELHEECESHGNMEESASEGE